MTSYSSQGGHVSFMTQAAEGTFPAGFAAGAVSMLLRSGALATNRDLLVPDPEIGGGRDVPDAYLGAVHWSGDYEFYGRMRALPTLLYAVMGLKATGPAGTSDVQTLTVTGGPTGGTFTLTYGADTTAPIAYNADAATVQAALAALASVGIGNVYVTGGPFPGSAMTVTFTGELNGTATLLTADSAALTGGAAPTVTVAHTTTGASVTGPGYQHTFWPSDAAELPFVAIEEAVGAGLEVFRYTDAVINTMHLECDANGYLMGTAGVIAKTQVAGSTPLTAAEVQSSLDVSPMTVGTNITATYNGVTLPAKSFKFDLNNNFADDDYRLGSFFLGDLTPKRREITVGVHIREQSSDLWRQASYGQAAATTPGGVTTKQGLQITMQTYELLGGVTPSTPFGITLNFPKAVLKPYSLAASGDDIIESDLEFQILRPQSNLPGMWAYVTNDQADVR